MSFFPPDIMLLERQTNITWSQIYSKSETDILRFSNNLFLNAILMLIFFSLSCRTHCTAKAELSSKKMEFLLSWRCTVMNTFFTFIPNSQFCIYVNGDAQKL